MLIIFFYLFLFHFSAKIPYFPRSCRLFTRLLVISGFPTYDYINQCWGTTYNPIAPFYLGQAKTSSLSYSTSRVLKLKSPGFWVIFSATLNRVEVTLLYIYFIHSSCYFLNKCPTNCESFRSAFPQLSVTYFMHSTIRSLSSRALKVNL